MKNRFIIGVDNMSAEEDKKFRNFLQTKNCGWWHWIDNFWLVTDRKENLGADDLRDALLDIARGKNSLVMPVSGDADWSGYGPSTEEKNMFRWLHKTWPRD